MYHINKKTNLYQHVQISHIGRVVSPPMMMAPVPVPPKVVETPKKEIKVNLIGMTCFLGIKMVYVYRGGFNKGFGTGMFYMF